MAQHQRTMLRPDGPAKVRRPRAAEGASTGHGDSVGGFLRNLGHPMKAGVAEVRGIILGVDPWIQDGIHWNSPPFRTKDWFATVNLCGKAGEDRVWLILHTGAKASPIRQNGLGIADPQGLLNGPAKDCALVTFGDRAEVRAKRTALAAIVRAWIARRDHRVCPRHGDAVLNRSQGARQWSETCYSNCGMHPGARESGSPRGARPLKI